VNLRPGSSLHTSALSLPPALTPTPSLKVELVTDADELAALEPEWTDLWERCPDAGPFQAPEWLLPWWRHLGRGRLCGVAVRSSERLVGLALLSVSSYFGMPVRRLGLLGTGITDRLGVLLEPALAHQGVEIMLAALAEHGHEWDFCDFQQLPESSPLLRAALPSGMRASNLPQEVCPYLPLPEAPEAVRASLPARMQANLRYYERRLARTGGGGVEAATQPNLGAALDDLFRLHQGRWRRRGLPGGFASSRVRAFHRATAPRLLERGWLRLLQLHAEGRTVAAMYCLVCRGTAYYYLGGFDPAAAALSPGTLLIARALEDAVRNGAREFDFLRGDEPYKYAWGAVNRLHSRRLLWRDELPSRLAPYLNHWERQVERRAKDWAARRAGRRS